MAEHAFAEHIIDSIRRELDVLKRYDYIQTNSYNEILSLLPTSTRSRGMPNASASPFAGAMPSPAKGNALPPPPDYNSANDKLGTAEALYDYNGANPDTDLNFRCGDIIQITEVVNENWWKGSSNGKTGIFPSNYVKKIDVKDRKGSPPPTPGRRDYSPQPIKQNDTFNNYPPPKQNDTFNNYPPPKQNDTFNNYPPPKQKDTFNNYSPSQSSSYAPPPVQTYAPPPLPVQTYAPPPPPVQTYSSPLPVQQNTYAPPPIQGQVQSYAPPPVQQVVATAPVVVEQQHESTMSTMGKKLAGNVANAATWGFGATLGSDLANSIF